MAAESEKPAWPLMVLAVTSFVPCLGFVLGSAAVTWGLLVPRRRRVLAMSIAATGALLNVGFGMLLAVMSASKFTPSANVSPDSLISVTQRQLDRTAVMIERFHAEHDAYPESLDELMSSVVWVADSGGVRVDTSKAVIPVDPLSAGAGQARMFQYVVSPDRQQYDLLSPGRDGKTPSSDDLRPRLPDSLRAKSGRQPGL